MAWNPLRARLELSAIPPELNDALNTRYRGYRAMLAVNIASLCKVAGRVGARMWLRKLLSVGVPQAAI